MNEQSYTGDVQVGGPADVRDMPGMTIRKLAVGDMANNAYLLIDSGTGPGTGQALLIDAAAEPDALLALIGGADLRTVVTTHGHRDHHGALPQVVEATRVQTVAHPADAADLPVPVTRTVEHGDTVAVGDHLLEVVHLRGHTPGSIALVWRGPEGAGTHVFTGDSLFPGGPGRTTNPTDFTSLMDDLEERIFERFDNGTWVYPGHGKDTTLGNERPHLAEWRDRGW